MKSLIVSAAALLAMSPAVFAHTELTGSTPANDAVLDMAPQQITLSFSEAARLTALSLREPNGTEQHLGPLPKQMQERFVVAAPHLTAGDYVVSWRALSDDGHVANGTVHFTIKAMPASH